MTIEIVSEILNNLRAHKLRTLLTSFGIIWGVFILVVMLGISGGVKDGVLNLFDGFTRNVIWFYGGESEDGMHIRESGRSILFAPEDIENIKINHLDKIKISSEIIIGDFKVLDYNRRNEGWFQLKAVGKDYFDVKGLKVSSGRSFNIKDYDEQRRVVIVGDRITQNLFGGENPIGRDILIKNEYFTIVGSLDEKSFFAMNEQNSIFMPQNIATNTIRKINGIPGFGILSNNYELDGIESRIKTYLSEKYHFSRDDQRALYIVNYKEQLSVFSTFFDGFDIFLVFVGFCLLLSGIIGISNIMYIVVKERTGEIGIKKAIGAPSSQILKEFILEALALTLFAGVIGLLLGIGALEIIDFIIAENLDGDEFFKKTNVNSRYVVLSILALSLAGFMAGLFPASKAAEISPVEAMKEL